MVSAEPRHRRGVLHPTTGHALCGGSDRCAAGRQATSGRLAFLADGRARIETFPWNLVRTYGWIKEQDMRRRTLWRAASGYGKHTYTRLEQELGVVAMKRLRDSRTRNKLLGRDCELLDFGEGDSAVTLMKKHQDRYFSTTYPPHSVAGITTP